MDPRSTSAQWNPDSDSVVDAAVTFGAMRRVLLIFAAHSIQTLQQTAGDQTDRYVYEQLVTKVKSYNNGFNSLNKIIKINDSNFNQDLASIS